MNFKSFEIEEMRKQLEKKIPNRVLKLVNLPAISRG